MSPTRCLTRYEIVVLASVDRRRASWGAAPSSVDQRFRRPCASLATAPAFRTSSPPTSPRWATARATRSPRTLADDIVTVEGERSKYFGPCGPAYYGQSQSGDDGRLWGPCGPPRRSGRSRAGFQRDRSGRRGHPLGSRHGAGQPAPPVAGAREVLDGSARRARELRRRGRHPGGLPADRDRLQPPSRLDAHDFHLPAVRRHGSSDLSARSL